MSSVAKSPANGDRPFIMRKGISLLSDLADGAAAYGDLGMGNVFYVNGGSDGPTGATGQGTKERPYQTIKEALACCITGHDDYVVVLNYGSNGRGTEDWPILVTKDQVHIIGVRQNEGNKWATVKPDETDNAFTVTGQRCEFAGLEIGGYSTGSGIQIGNAVWGTTIHDCWFGVTGDTAGTNGIYVAAGADAPHSCFYHNRFGVHLTGDGILIAGNATRSWILDNSFYHIVGVAINITGAGGLNEISGNRFGMSAQTEGDAIKLSSGTSGIFLHNNHAAYGKTTDTTGYYVDAGSNDWGWNTVNGVSLRCT